MRKKISRLLILAFFLVLLSSVVSAKNLINEKVSVNPLTFMSYYLDMETDQTIIKLSINVFLGDITVGVLDEASYALWVDGNDAPAYFVRDDLVEGDFEIELGPAGIYYIVLDNSDSILFSVQVKIVVSVPSPLETMGIVIAIVVVAAIVVIVIVNSNKRKRAQQPSVPQMIQTPYVITPVEQPIIKAHKFCKECGSQLDTDATFCTNCGMKQ